ncbi:MAG: nucleotidyltransferase family protein [Saprospiraceae bacterium]
MKPTLLILAAGMGSRYGGIKQIDSVGPSGEIILEYSIYDAIQAGFGKVVFVIRKDIEDAFKSIGLEGKFADKIKIAYVYQDIHAETNGFDVNDRTKPWGTGHAILMGASRINEPFAAINADDYYGRDAFIKMADFLSHQASADHFCMVGYTLENTLSENGFVSRGVCSIGNRGLLKSVNERTNISKIENGDIVYLDELKNQHLLAPSSIVSMNYWGFHPSVFSALREKFHSFLSKYANDLKAEFYIPSAIAEMVAENSTEVSVLLSEDQWYGVTYKEDKEKVQVAFKELLATGVYPANLWK